MIILRLEFFVLRGIIRRYFKSIYCQVKFFTDTKEEIKYPNFVVNDQNNHKKQMVQICKWLLVNS